VRDANMEPELALDFTSGYVQRSVHLLPKQGDRKPWKLYQNYFLDFLSLKLGSLRDESIEFNRAGEQLAETEALAN
jgi:monooxygenase